jgi:hypothetical protein
MTVFLIEKQLKKRDEKIDENSNNRKN